MSRVRKMVGLILVAVVATVPVASPASANDACGLQTTLSISVTPTFVLLGQSVTVQWTTVRPATCTFPILLNTPTELGRVVSPNGSVVEATTNLGRQVWGVVATTTVPPSPVKSAETFVAAHPRQPAGVAVDNDGGLDLLSTAGSDVVSLSKQGRVGGAFGPPVQQSLALHAVAAERDARNHVIQAGLDKNMNIFVRDQLTFTGWGEWAQIDGLLNSVALARNDDITGPDYLEMFGTNHLGQVWHRRQGANLINGQWEGWRQHWGPMKQVAAETNVNGLIELYGVNARGEAFVCTQVARNAPDYSSWTPILGGNLFSRIAVARNANGLMELMANKSGGTFAHMRQTAVGSTTFTAVKEENDGNLRIDGVGAEIGLNGRIEAFATATNGPNTGAVVHRAQTDANATTWTPWAPLTTAVS